MGMLIWFYVGDEKRVGAGFSASAEVPLWGQPFVRAMADFSLHLSPVDLDLFSEETCRVAGVPPITLTDSLTENVGGDGQTCSADLVSPQWVEVIASIPEHRVEELAKRWLAQVAAEHGKRPEEPSADALRAIRELTHACRVAKETGLPVVHTWTL